MSQITCGTLKSVSNNPDGLKFIGNVMLGGRLNGQLAFRDNPRATKENDAPEFDVLYRPDGVSGAARPMGAAWLKNSDKVSGGDFLSIMLDDPDWTSPLNLTAFPPDKGTEWRVVWSRPRGARVQEAA